MRFVIDAQLPPALARLLAAHGHHAEHVAAPVILWLRVGNTSRRALLAWFEPLLPQIEELIRRGERLIEVR